MGKMNKKWGKPNKKIKICEKRTKKGGQRTIIPENRTKTKVKKIDSA
jgi:hypothetical protein